MFYRNFESKEDVIRQHLLLLIRERGARFEEKGEPSAPPGAVISSKTAWAVFAGLIAAFRGEAPVRSFQNKKQTARV